MKSTEILTRSTQDITQDSQPSDCDAGHLLQRVRQLWRRARVVERLPGGELYLPLARQALSELLCRLTYGRGDMPLTVGIETQAICNRRCSYCTVPSPDFVGSRSVRVMNQELYGKILNDLASFPRRHGAHGFCGTLHLNGFGEPLLDKNIEARVRLARIKLPETRIGFYSNGDYLTEDRYLSLKQAGVREIIITPHDGQHRPELLELAEKFADDEIIVLNQPLTAFSNRAGSLPITVSQLQSPARYCIHPTYSLEITADGQVAYCANDSLLKRPMGSVVESSIMSVWDDPTYVQLRNNLRRGRVSQLPETCKACRTGVDTK